MLGSAALPAGQIAQAFAVSRPAVSRHLRVLREAGLVRHRDSGRERMYQLELAGLKETEGFLAALRAAQSDERKAWERRFMALDTEVHRVHARSKTVTHRTNPVKKRKTA